MVKIVNTNINSDSVRSKQKDLLVIFYMVSN